MEQPVSSVHSSSCETEIKATFQVALERYIRPRMRQSLFDYAADDGDSDAAGVSN